MKKVATVSEAFWKTGIERGRGKMTHQEKGNERPDNAGQPNHN